MQINKKKIFFLIYCFCLTGCGATLCTKGDTHQGVFFNYGSSPVDYADISSMPTFTSSASFVKKLIVKKNGFFAVTAQKTVHCDNFPEMKQNPSIGCQGYKLVDNYTLYLYTKEEGYKEWGNFIPENEWRAVNNLNHSFSKQPNYHYKNCRYHFFGKLYMLLQIIRRV